MRVHEQFDAEFGQKPLSPTFCDDSSLSVLSTNHLRLLCLLCLLLPTLRLSLPQ